jgi:hypothetical protein
MLDALDGRILDRRVHFIPRTLRIGRDYHIIRGFLIL